MPQFTVPGLKKGWKIWQRKDNKTTCVLVSPDGKVNPEIIHCPGCNLPTVEELNKVIARLERKHDNG
jgi:hypothetical protein